MVFIQQNNFFIHAIGTLNYLYLGTIIMSKEIILFHQIWILFGINYAYVKLLCIIHMYLMHNYIVHVEAVLIAKCFPILFRKEGFVEDYFKTMADSSIPYHDQNRGLYCIFLKSLNRKLIYIESQESWPFRCAVQQSWNLIILSIIAQNLHERLHRNKSKLNFMSF